MMKIPRCMSTQHPDNVSTPFFADRSVLEGDAEVREAYYAYSHLGCDEQMWDAEGKEVDNFVVKKLLSGYEPFFRRKKLGRDVFLTLRLPNPAIEKDEAKILLETLESIPRSFDIARGFYGEGISPIFEVILPMSSNAAELNRIYHYYRRFVVGKQHQELEGLKISDWTGSFSPDSINVIPLFETREDMLKSDLTMEEYLKGKSVERQRVFLARSDPAINYGSLPAVLLNKIALQRLHSLQEKLSVELLPMIGAGSSPFRGNLTPITVKNILSAYPSVQTFTIQSAFKYDYDEGLVRDAIEELHSSERHKPLIVDEARCIAIIDKVSAEYRSQIKMLLPLIQELSLYVPARRKRKMHIGLYRYSRDIGGFSLPRAIPFCAALYSAGIVPDVIGLDALSPEDLDYVREIHPNFDDDCRAALKCLNMESLKRFPLLEKKVAGFLEKLGFEADAKYASISSSFMENISRRNFRSAEENMIELARMRNFLG